MSGATRTMTDKFRIDIRQQSLDDLHDRLTRVAVCPRSPGPNLEDYGVSLAHGTGARASCSGTCIRGFYRYQWSC